MSYEPTQAEINAAADALKCTFIAHHQANLGYDGHRFTADFVNGRNSWLEEARAALLAAHNVRTR